jgi:hypothetical protein
MSGASSSNSYDSFYVAQDGSNKQSFTKHNMAKLKVNHLESLNLNWGPVPFSSVIPPTSLIFGHLAQHCIQCYCPQNS